MPHLLAVTAASDHTCIKVRKKAYVKQHKAAELF